MNQFKLYFSYVLSIFNIQKRNHLSVSFLSVETANFCNLHCPQCPVGTGENTHIERKTFDLQLYKKLVDELKPTLQHIILYFQGEPFLNKQLTDFIEYAHRSKIYTSTSTNGQFLSKNNAKNIVASGLDKLIVSVDGATQEVYERYRVGGNLEKALSGISEIIYWKNELKSLTPLVELQFIVFKTNEHQIPEMKKLAKMQKVNRLVFKKAQIYDFENGNALIPTQPRYSRYKQTNDGKYTLKSAQNNRCWRLWNGAVVNASGEVLPCCFDKSSAHSFGNINDQSFYACLKEKKATGFRDSILQNRQQYEMCRNCTE